MEYLLDRTISVYEAEHARITEGLGYPLHRLQTLVEGAVDSCVTSESVRVFLEIARLNATLPLPESKVGYGIPELLRSLDLVEGTCGWFAFASINGGIDIDCMTSHGKGACYGDGKTDAIYGMRLKDNIFMDNVLLVDAHACAVLDSVVDCVQNFALSIQNIMEDRFEFLPETADVFECDDCGAAFSPEEYSVTSITDYRVYECESCDEPYVKNAASQDCRVCPECGKECGAEVERKSADGCPCCIHGDLHPMYLLDL